MVEMCKGATANNVRRGGKRRDRQTPHTRSAPTCQRWLRVWLRHVEFYAVDVTKCLSTYEVLLYTPNWPSSTKYGYKTPKYGTEGRYTTGVGGYPSPELSHMTTDIPTASTLQRCSGNLVVPAGQRSPQTSTQSLSLT